jgi:hypothetical protein
MILRGLTIVVLCLLVTGCAGLAPAGSLLSPLQGSSVPLQVHEQTSVNLSQDNFMLVKTNVFGVSKGFSLLGFINIYPATLSKAMNRMYASAEMSTGKPQTVAHLIIEHSSSFWILFGLPRTEVHADIVEFRPAASSGKKGEPGPAPAKPPD